MKIHETSCYSDLSAYHFNEEQHIGYLEMREGIIQNLSKLSKNKASNVLEFGSGTGLLTKEIVKLQHIKLTASEPDSRCISILKEHLQLNDLVQQPIENLNSNLEYDFILSSFAHDHIKDTNALVNSLYKNLKPNGYYICGLELLREYNDSTDKIQALYDWHNYVIKKALDINNKELAFLEQEALESGIKGIADFKVSKSNYENSLSSNGFSLVSCNTTTTQPNIGGVYYYVWQKI